jgi:hypothetical protein
VGQIRLEVPAVGIALSQAENRSVLLVATATRVSAFDLRVPASPVLVDEWRLRGVRGMRMIGREAWVWGEFGILTLAVRQSPRAVGELKGVIAVDRRQDVTYVLSGDTVLLCGDDLTRIGSISFRRAVSVAALRGGFAVAGDETVVLFRLEGRRVARPVHELRRADVSDLVRLPIAVAQRALFIRARGGGGSVFDVSEMYRPFEVARYVADPWFFGLHRLGDYTIKVARGAHVDIYVEAGRAVRRLGWTGPDPADG